MRSVGPFELTDAEFAGMETLCREDERRLKNAELRATWRGHHLIVESCDALAVPAEAELIQLGLMVENRSHSRWRNQADPETGESGETADVEAESEIIGRNPEILELWLRRSRGSDFDPAITR
jgi:hypothetical protein